MDVLDLNGQPILVLDVVREYLDVPGLFDLAMTSNTFVVVGFTSNGRVICSDLKAREPDNLEKVE
jgi:hypothetical protein